MPLKRPPNVFQILAKSHRLTVFLNAPHPTTVGQLKTQALAALTQFADTDIPMPTSVKDFELCQAKTRQGKVESYEILETDKLVRDTLRNWEVIYFRFRNESGKLQDVHVEQPIDDEEPEPVSPIDSKGKRKAPPT